MEPRVFCRIISTAERTLSLETIRVADLVDQSRSIFGWRHCLLVVVTNLL